MNIHPKVVGATTGAGLGGAIVVLVVYVLSLFNVNLPQNVIDALTIVIGALGAFLAGYLAPNSATPAPPTSAAPPQNGTR